MKWLENLRSLKLNQNHNSSLEFYKPSGNFPPDGIVLYAKQSGLTSFTSLWAIKHALNTSKIGHTGTLDNFADGLLVVLSNRMTKFVSHITDFDKSYEAIIKFGEETDTLDVDGTVIKTSSLPTKADFEKACQNFTGELEQTPPVYSAIQVNGRRASDLVREGQNLELKKRKITIYENTLVEFTGEYAHIRVSCSKGTYIRTLASDMAKSCNSTAHLVALRRTRVGSFELKNAAGFDKLPDFCIKNLARLLTRKENSADIEEASEEEIQNSVLAFTPKLAKKCGFNCIFVKEKFLKDFLQGKPLNKTAFFCEDIENIESGEKNIGLGGRAESVAYGEEFSVQQNTEYVVFAKRGEKGVACGEDSDFSKSSGDKNFQNSERKLNERLCGLVKFNGNRLKYIFVIANDLPVAKPVNHKKPQKKNSKNIQIKAKQIEKIEETKKESEK